MNVRTLENTYVFLKDEHGKIRNQMMLIVAKSGYGKGLAGESIAEEFHSAGYTVLVIADPKDELEYAYSMFEPKEHYHLAELRKVGKRPEAKPVKLYHPFTFRIPRFELPDIQFYTFSLKALGRKEWSMIAESAWDTDTIKLLLNASQNIPRSAGLYGFVHYLQELVRGQHDGRRLKPDPHHFYLSVTGGTLKSIQDIVNYLQPFRTDYFLAPDTSALTLDWKSILADHEHYHVFVSNWLRDPKLKEFCVLALFNQIIANKDHAKRPLLIVIPEIRYLVPFRPQGYQQFLAGAIKENLSMMRSMGRGMSALLDTQVYTGVDEDVANSATVTFIGELGGIRDAEKIAKALRYKREVSDQLKRMEYPNSYFITGYEKMGPFRPFFPSHRHCEPEYNFFEHYKRDFGNQLKDYGSLVETQQAELKKEEQKFKDIVKKHEEEEHAREEAIRQEREAKKAKDEKVEAAMEKAKAVEQRGKLELMRLVYEFRQQNPNLSWRKIAEQFKIDHKTAKQYCERWENRAANQTNNQPVDLPQE